MVDVPSFSFLQGFLCLRSTFLYDEHETMISSWYSKGLKVDGSSFLQDKGDLTYGELVAARGSLDDFTDFAGRVYYFPNKRDDGTTQLLNDNSFGCYFTDYVLAVFDVSFFLPEFVGVSLEIPSLFV